MMVAPLRALIIPRNFTVCAERIMHSDASKIGAIIPIDASLTGLYRVITLNSLMRSNTRLPFKTRQATGGHRRTVPVLNFELLTGAPAGTGVLLVRGRRRP